MTSLHVICGFPPIKNPGYTYGPGPTGRQFLLISVVQCTRVLLYANMQKETENHKTFLSHFYHQCHFNWEGVIALFLSTCCFSRSLQYKQVNDNLKLCDMINKLYFCPTIFLSFNFILINSNSNSFYRVQGRVRKNYFFGCKFRKTIEFFRVHSPGLPRSPSRSLVDLVEDILKKSLDTPAYAFGKLYFWELTFKKFLGRNVLSNEIFAEFNGKQFSGKLHRTTSNDQLIMMYLT